MTNRQTAVLVTVAVVAGATLAGVGLATRGSSKSRPVLKIDEQRGLVGRVALHETVTNVYGVLGHSRVVDLGPGGDALLYPHLRIGLKNGKVVSIETDQQGAETDKVLRVGDPLSAARALYRKSSHCIPSSDTTTAPNPHCTITVPSGRLVIKGDPIASIALVAR
ncbi:MAG TPA: hypothetical protein VLJ76_07360 [Gaiellaceae bacterium]|nr:hypothetical protein [Gaiellaceae bacterium]